jgi:hypothetical protein
MHYIVEARPTQNLLGSKNPADGRRKKRLFLKKQKLWLAVLLFNLARTFQRIKYEGKMNKEGVITARPRRKVENRKKITFSL